MPTTKLCSRVVHIRGNIIMDYTPVLLIFVFHVLTGIGAPLEEEQIKSKVEEYTNLLIVRLSQNFQTPPMQTLRPPVKELGGLSSIVAVLEGYNNLISDSLENVTQIKTELSILTEYIHKWSVEHCNEQLTKPPEPEALRSLQKLKRFVHTVGLEALIRVKEYLNLLRRNLDHLDIC